MRDFKLPPAGDPAGGACCRWISGTGSKSESENLLNKQNSTTRASPMGLRLTPTDAAARGLISKIEAAEMERQARSGRNQTPVVKGMPKPVAEPAPKAEPAPAAKQLNAEKKADNEIPQRRLFDALRVHLPEAQWEREGLIEGRKYRADIFLPPNIVVEMDGFGFHRSKQAFQNDRLRSNIFTQHGFRVFRAFTKQCLDDVMLAELVALIVDAHARPLPANVP